MEERIIEGANGQMYYIEIAIILLGAFILGYVLRWLLNDKYKKQIKKLELDISMLKLNSKPEESFKKLETNIIAQQAEIDKLKSLLKFAKTDKEDALRSADLLKKEIEALQKSKSVEEATETPAFEPEQVQEQEEIVLSTSQKDDLTKIEGVGPKIEQILNEAGIATFRDILSKPPSEIKSVLVAQSPTYAVHDPATWAEQAKLAVANKWEELASLQLKLKGGKRK